MSDYTTSHQKVSGWTRPATSNRKECKGYPCDSCKTVLVDGTEFIKVVSRTKPNKSHGALENICKPCAVRKGYLW